MTAPGPQQVGRRSGHQPGAPAAVDPGPPKPPRRWPSACSPSPIAPGPRCTAASRTGVPPSTAAATVDRLAARGWMDDERLADDLARRRSSHGYGRRRVLADLVARGVESETVSRIAAELDGRPGRGGPAWRPSGSAHGQPGRRAPDEVRRLAAALQRRGFDMTDIRAALRRLADRQGDRRRGLRQRQAEGAKAAASRQTADEAAGPRSRRTRRPSSRKVIATSSTPKTTRPSKDARLTARPPRKAPSAPPAARVTV